MPGNARGQSPFRRAGAAQIKWDGYWLMAHVDHGKVVLRTRRGHDWTERFPSIATALAALPVRSAVVEDERGGSKLLCATSGPGAREEPGHKPAMKPSSTSSTLYLDGRDFCECPVWGAPPLLGEDPLGGRRACTDV